MGGTGKTPFVICTARMLSEMGFEVAILTRGYGRRDPGKTIILQPSQLIQTPEKTIGDEPSLIRRQLPSVWMGVSRNRFLAGSMILKQTSSPIFLLDDGFQHRKLHRNLDIVILDPCQPLGSNRIFPRGSLREPASELRRAGALVVNGFQDSPSISELNAQLARFSIPAPIFYCTQSIKELIPFSDWNHNKAKPLSNKLPGSAFLVTAIGNPERFNRDIRRMGIEVSGTRYFRDHHCLSEQDWLACAKEAEKCRAETIVITEKDAVKITNPPRFPLRVAVQSTEMQDSSGFRELLRQIIAEH
jgi:tetraacyldisaccharide 4'-kinase